MTAAASRIVVWPDPILERVADKVTVFDDELAELVEMMHATVLEQHALGLAAPQIGVSKRLFVIRSFPGAFCNSEIVAPSAEVETKPEGCLSLPGLTVPVERPVRLKILYQDLQGRDRAWKVRGMDARCAAHEHDHTRGLLITHRAEAF